MTSRRPYLIRAMNEWMLDNGWTPHLVVQADVPDAELPRQFVQEGRIVLNVSPSATQGLRMGNDLIEFNARFSGQPQHVSFPASAVIAIYARETGQGMMFGDDEPPPEGDGPGAGGEGPDRGQRPNLKVVK